MTRVLVCAGIFAASCGGGQGGPELVALGQDPCAHCRMVIVSTATAAQVVTPGEEPRFFDDIGCLRDYLAASPVTPDLTAYVADHRTGAWVDARHAVFTRTSLSTPMVSGLLAHADLASRDADPDAGQGETVATAAVLGPVARSVAP